MKEHIFTLYWRDGKKQTIKGFNIADAFTAAGYGAGAMGALDFYEKGDSNEYKWNTETKTWDWTKINQYITTN